MGIRGFRNSATPDINYGRTTKSALKLLPQPLHRKAQLKLARLNAASSLQDFRNCEVTDLRLCEEIEPVDTASELMSSIGCAFNGMETTRITLRLLIIMISLGA